MTGSVRPSPVRAIDRSPSGPILKPSAGSHSPIGTDAYTGVALLRGLFTFYAICALGTVANVGIAGYIFSRNEIWWPAGLAGVVVGSVWNYAVSSVFTWKQK
jgi:hypothetical protein